MRIDLTTFSLRVRCSTIEPHQQRTFRILAHSGDKVKQKITIAQYKAYNIAYTNNSASAHAKISRFQKIHCFQGFFIASFPSQFVYIIISEYYYADSYQQFQHSFQHQKPLCFQYFSEICKLFQNPEVKFRYKLKTKNSLHNSHFRK